MTTPEAHNQPTQELTLLSPDHVLAGAYLDEQISIAQENGEETAYLELLKGMAEVPAGIVLTDYPNPDGVMHASNSHDKYIQMTGDKRPPDMIIGEIAAKYRWEIAGLNSEIFDPKSREIIEQNWSMAAALEMKKSALEDQITQRLAMADQYLYGAMSQ